MSCIYDHLAASGQWIISSPIDGLADEDAALRTLEALREALEPLERLVEDEAARPNGAAFFALNPRGEDYEVEVFDPWAEEVQAFWQLVAKTESLHPTAELLFLAAGDLLQRWGPDAGAEGLWEAEGVQFCEAALAVLALGAPDFLAHYLRFLDLWDLESASSQYEITQALVEAHGEEPEAFALEAKLETF
ncbi:hypothetical protein ACQ5SO_07075 [Rhodovulum sp. DZ06]|uniref:hypothetical protein n=1 Tax=Rhodovulum sp. DZ06 TaxID=3425126 RepID=UPI003D329637